MKPTPRALLVVLLLCGSSPMVMVRPACGFMLSYFPDGGGYLIDPELDLPMNPTIEQQIKAGKQVLDRLRESDQTLDQNAALDNYFNALVQRLIAAQKVKPPYPIVAHVSTTGGIAQATVGGVIIIHTRAFELSDNEAQLVAIIAHELSHESHDDFVFSGTQQRTMLTCTAHTGCSNRRAPLNCVPIWTRPV